MNYCEKYLTDIFNYSKFERTPKFGLGGEVSSQKIIFFNIFNNSFYKKENSLVFFSLYNFETKNYLLYKFL
jgi:hypothetical protein